MWLRRCSWRMYLAERPIAILPATIWSTPCWALRRIMRASHYALDLPTAYSLVSTDFGKLRYIFDLLTPGLIFVSDAAPFRKALEAVKPADAELIDNGASGAFEAAQIPVLAATQATADVDRAHDAVTPDTIAKILFTSGSTGPPRASRTRSGC